MPPLLDELRRLLSRLPGAHRPVILMYHRVADLSCDPWQLAVKPRHFAEQIDALGRHRAIVPLSWLVAELEQGRVPKKVACLTFDDGYADVLHAAKPILEKFSAPATAFLTTGALGKRREFWWDELSRLLLLTERLPEDLALDLAGRRIAWHGAQRQRANGAHGADAEAERTAFHLEVWKAIRLLHESVRDVVLRELARRCTEAPAAKPLDRALDLDEAAKLAVPGFIDIGAHGTSHASLPSLSDREKRRELRESREACERLLGRAVTSLAYPFGDFDEATESAARDCGFELACSTEPGVVVSHRQRLRLPRVAAGDWSGEEFEARLLADPRRFVEAST